MWIYSAIRPSTRRRREHDQRMPLCARMPHYVLFLAGFGLALRTMAGDDQRQADTWTVQARGRTVALASEGKVACDKGDVANYLAPARRLYIKWCAPEGSRVKRGDPLHIYETTRGQNIIPAKELAAIEAEWVYRTKSMELQAELDTLLEKKADLQRRSQVTLAARGTLTSVDAMKVELLRREYAQAQQAMQTQQSNWQKEKELFLLGQISRRNVDQAELALRQAELAAADAEARWRLTSNRIDLCAVQLNALEIEEIRSNLGQTEGTGVPGIAMQIDALKAKLDQARAQALTAKETADRELREALRDAFDHTPLNWIEVSRAGTLLYRIRFQPRTNPVFQGWQTDSGAPFDEQRGYGWDADRSAAMLSRGSNMPERTLALLRGESVWRCRTGTGEVDLAVSVGDEYGWKGVYVRADGEPILVANHLKDKEYRQARHHLTVVGDDLEIRCGSPHAKTLRAEVDGVVTQDPWSPKTGDKTWGPGWPCIYLTQPEKHLVEARVTPEWANLLTAAPAVDSRPDAATNVPGVSLPPADDSDYLMRKLAVNMVEVQTPSGNCMTGKVINVDNTPIRLSFAPVGFFEREEDSRDKIGRQIRIRLEPADAARLQLHSMVKVKVRFRVPEGTPWIPLQFVRQSEYRFSVFEAGAGIPRAVKGFRAGDIFLITHGITPGGKLMLPSLADTIAATVRKAYDGKVAPGARTPVAIGEHVWGKIKDLLPDGSWVKADDWVMTLYNPWLDENAKLVIENRRMAEQKYLQAAEDRRLKAVTANLEHRQKVLAEKRKRVELRALLETNPQNRLEAENACQATRIAYRDAVNVAEAMQESDAFSPAELEAAKRRCDLAQVLADRKQLALVGVLRAQDWLAVAQARADLEATRRELGIRDIVLNLARQEEEAGRLRARLELDTDSVSADGRINFVRVALKAFEKGGVVRAPAAGRLFYKDGFNELTKQAEKINKEFEVWDDLRVADILDMNRLGFEAELPETIYHRLRLGMDADLVFGHLDGLILPAKVSEIGRSFFIPEDAAAEGLGKQVISNRKFFKVTLSFNAPKAFQERLIPGTKGQVIIQ